jgi:hypothetical protein
MATTKPPNEYVEVYMHICDIKLKYDKKEENTRPCESFVVFVLE